MDSCENEIKRMFIKLKNMTLRCGFDINKYPKQNNQNRHIMCVRAREGRHLLAEERSTNSRTETCEGH